MNNKKIILPIIIISLILLVLGSTFAFYRWSTSRNEESEISLVVSGSEDDLYARLNGNISMSTADLELLPTNNCLGTTALQKDVNIIYKNSTSQKAKVEAQLDITKFNLSDSSYTLTAADLSHIHWAITTSSSSCTTNVVSTGTFQGITFTNGQISNMTNDSLYGNIYNLNNGNSMIKISVPANTNQEVTTSTYYVYIWIDEGYAHTNYGDVNDDPMGNFDLTLEWHGKIYQYIPEPNAPQLVDGLIPVKLSDTGNVVTTVSPDDPTWYDYSSKKWANAILISVPYYQSHIRDIYTNTPGTTVNQSYIVAYYVWIPRYSYKVWQYSGNSLAGQEKEIKIRFEDIDTIETATQNDEWHTHPAFWWDNDSDGVREDGEELAGIWVGKFEVSHTTFSNQNNYYNRLSCSTTDCANTANIRILPNVISLRNNNIFNFFYASRYMQRANNSFALNAIDSDTDSHMIKDREWGAVTYLSHSQYGINTVIRKNNNTVYTTGCGALSLDSGLTSDCDNAYGSVSTYPQSTTGNVTGIFDMSGGALEYVMGHYNSGLGSESGFSSLPSTKYYDNFTSVSCTFSVCGGHALNETAGWYGVSFNINSGSSYVWFNRGGYGSYSGIYKLSQSSGKYASNISSRFTLIETY